VAFSNTSSDMPDSSSSILCKPLAGSTDSPGSKGKSPTRELSPCEPVTRPLAGSSVLIPRTIIEHTFDRQVLSPTIFKKHRRPRIATKNPRVPVWTKPENVGTRRSSVCVGVILHGEDRVAAPVLECDEVTHLRDRETLHLVAAVGYRCLGVASRTPGSSSRNSRMAASRCTQPWSWHPSRHALRKPGCSGKTRAGTRIGQQGRHRHYRPTPALD